MELSLIGMSEVEWSGVGNECGVECTLDWRGTSCKYIARGAFSQYVTYQKGYLAINSLWSVVWSGVEWGGGTSCKYIARGASLQYVTYQKRHPAIEGLWGVVWSGVGWGAGSSCKYIPRGAFLQYVTNQKKAPDD